MLFAFLSHSCLYHRLRIIVIDNRYIYTYCTIFAAWFAPPVLHKIKQVKWKKKEDKKNRSVYFRIEESLT